MMGTLKFIFLGTLIIKMEATLNACFSTLMQAYLDKYTLLGQVFKQAYMINFSHEDTIRNKTTNILLKTGLTKNILMERSSKNYYI